MLKILPLITVVAIAATTMASRKVRSPGGSGWPGSNSFDYGSPSVGVARSSFGGWSGSGKSQGRSGGYGSSGWSGAQGFGSSGRSASNGYPSGGGWNTNGYSSKTGYGGNGYNSNGGWGSSFADQTDSAFRSSNGWGGSGIGRSNYGW